MYRPNHSLCIFKINPYLLDFVISNPRKQFSNEFIRLYFGSGYIISNRVFCVCQWICFPWKFQQDYFFIIYSIIQYNLKSWKGFLNLLQYWMILRMHCGYYDTSNQIVNCHWWELQHCKKGYVWIVSYKMLLTNHCKHALLHIIPQINWELKTRVCIDWLYKDIDCNYFGALLQRTLKNYGAFFIILNKPNWKYKISWCVGTSPSSARGSLLGLRWVANSA